MGKSTATRFILKLIFRKKILSCLFVEMCFYFDQISKKFETQKQPILVASKQRKLEITQKTTRLVIGAMQSFFLFGNDDNKSRSTTTLTASSQ
jgi:hypothetical protein